MGMARADFGRELAGTGAGVGIEERDTKSGIDGARSFTQVDISTIQRAFGNVSLCSTTCVDICSLAYDPVLQRPISSCPTLFQISNATILRLIFRSSPYRSA
jgi:hypothetical protein